MLKQKGCNGCSLQQISNGFSLPEGTGSNGVLLYGEALGYHEYLDAKPFRPKGAAGSLLETAFRLTRTSRENYLLDNLCRCQPPNDYLAGARYEHSAINHCNQMYSARVLNNPNVRVVVALGALPFKFLTGMSGKKLGISDCRGYVLWSDVINKLVVGSYHPAHIRRGKLAYTDYLVHDIRKALEVSRGRFDSFCTPEKYKQKYQLTPSLDDAKSFFYRVKDNPNLDLAYDIETPNSQEAEEDEREELEHEPITSIQFSLGKGEGIYMPWEGHYITAAKAILRRSNRKLGFNVWHFDNPKLFSNDTVVNGEVVDLMWKFHHLKPDLEMGLQKVASMCDWVCPWKHLSLDRKFERLYGCFDVDVLHWIEPKLELAMKSMKVESEQEINV